jgi:hypothetical protein
MEAWLALIVTTASTIGGAVTGAVIALKGARGLSRDERQAYERAETVRVYRLFVEEMTKMIIAMARLPRVAPSNIMEEAASGLLNLLRGEERTQMAHRRRIRESYGDRYYDLGDRIVATSSNLRLREMPSSARAAIDDALDYMRQVTQTMMGPVTEGPAPLCAEWDDVSSRLFAAGQELERWASSNDSPHTLRTNVDKQRSTESHKDR